ncbi:hypothetical protein R1flu_027264 [Riccia fluitans]|uniref:Uncharacterized protein n=1 Tax=Riccia fluitans TaxID=41844 RepID=A0ABD1XIE0_9MARC
MQRNFKLPEWSFHLGAYEGNVFVVLCFSGVFETLWNSENSYSGEFSALIPEVRVIDKGLVRRLLEAADTSKHDYPTMMVVQGEMFFIAFGSVEYEKGERRPHHVFAYSPSRNVSRWLPDIRLHSTRSYLPDLHAFGASFGVVV